MRSSDNRFASALAGVGGTLSSGYSRPTWRQVVCPKEGCGAPTQTLCRRFISEKFSSGKTTGVFTHEGGGRWKSLKHPHPERKRAAREETS